MARLVEVEAVAQTLQPGAATGGRNRTPTQAHRWAFARSRLSDADPPLAWGEVDAASIMKEGGRRCPRLSAGC